MRSTQQEGLLHSEVNMKICTEAGNYHSLLCKPSGELPELHGIKHSVDVINDAGEVFQYRSLKNKAPGLSMEHQ